MIKKSPAVWQVFVKQLTERIYLIRSVFYVHTLD